MLRQLPPLQKQIMLPIFRIRFPALNAALVKSLKEKTAYGCTLWQTGCTFRFPFAEVRKKAEGRPLTKELVYAILNGG